MRNANAARTKAGLAAARFTSATAMTVTEAQYEAACKKALEADPHGVQAEQQLAAHLDAKLMQPGLVGSLGLEAGDWREYFEYFEYFELEN